MNEENGAVAKDSAESPDLQKIANDLREENAKKRNQIKELKEQVDSLKVYQDKVAEFEKTLKEQEDGKLQEKEEFKKLYEKEKAERDKVYSDYEKLKKDFEDADKFRKSKIEQEEAEKTAIREELKAVSEDAYDTSLDIKDLSKLKKFREILSEKKETATHVAPGAAKLGGKGDLMTIDSLNSEELLKLRESNYELYLKHVKNISGKK
jgi:chromosome segregation ATPase